MSHLHTIPYPEPVVIQWQSSGNQVCMELRPQCTLKCHWRKIVVSQCVSSALPVVFQCVPIMQINTGSPLGYHWVLASASVVPVASQCTCGSSGLPVWSVQWYPSVLTESGLGVIRSGCDPSMRPLMYTTGMVGVVWAKLISFDLEPQIHKNYNGAHIKSIHRVISKWSHVLKAELVSIAEQ